MQAISLKPVLYNGIIHLPSYKARNSLIPLTGGCVYYIRFIRSDHKLYLPNESFTLAPDLKYSYVVAEINIETQALIIRQNNEIKEIFPYTIDAVSW